VDRFDDEARALQVISPHALASATIHEVSAKRTRPGLAKTRGMSLLHTRNVELWLSSDYRFRQLFEVADVMSEGATRQEAEGRFYYGSTSLLIPTAKLRELAPERAHDVARLLAADPHARLRAVRIACLEAQLRAGGPLGRVRAELVVRRERRGVRVDIEVEARVHGESSVTPSVQKTRAATPRKKRGSA
jgi:hypothetical protein